MQELAFLAIPVFPDFPLFSLGIHRALEASGSLPVAPLAVGEEMGIQHRDHVPGVVSSSFFKHAEPFQT